MSLPGEPSNSFLRYYNTSTAIVVTQAQHWNYDTVKLPFPFQLPFLNELFEAVSQLHCDLQHHMEIVACGPMVMKTIVRDFHLLPYCVKIYQNLFMTFTCFCIFLIAMQKHEANTIYIGHACDIYLFVINFTIFLFSIAAFMNVWLGYNIQDHKDLSG